VKVLVSLTRAEAAAVQRAATEAAEPVSVYLRRVGLRAAQRRAVT